MPARPELAVIAALLLATAVLPARAGDDAIVIELGDTNVSRAEVDARFHVAVRLLAHRQGISLADQDPAAIEQLREQFLGKYASDLVMLGEARRRQLQVHDAAVDKARAELFASDAEEQAFLADAAPDTAGRELLEQIIRDEKAVELLTEVMVAEIRIPPGDVITLHHDVKDRIATPEEVCVRHIQTDTVEAANGVLTELEQGADFADLAKAHSTDEASAPMGGDLGCFDRSHSAARSEFERVAFAAEENKVVGPVASRFGHHVLVVYEHRMPRAPTLNEAYATIERDLALEQLPGRIQALIDASGLNIYPDRFHAAAE